VIAESLIMIAMLAETKVKLEALPPAVQAAVKEQTKNATLVGLSKEKENGRMEYEAETKVNGKSRDVTFDEKGSVLEVEEEIDIATIPDAAKAAIEKRAAGGTIRKVEKLTAGTNINYEAAITSKSGKKSEVNVNADGSPHKE